MSIQDVQKIMEEIDRDKPEGTTTVKKTDGESTLNFNEFCQIMGNVEGGSTAELVQSFAQKAKSESRAFQAKDPLWKTLMTQDEGEGGLSFSSGRNARMKLAQLIDGDNTQIVIMVLIALDVVAVILEIIVHNLYCPCDKYYLSDPYATESEWKTDFVPKWHRVELQVKPNSDSGLQAQALPMENRLLCACIGLSRRERWDLSHFID